MAVVIACYTGYYAGSGLSSGALTYSQAASISFAGGFAAGAVQSGTLRGAAMGGISSLAFFGVAQAFPVKGMNIGTGEGMAAYSKLALASGVTGGVMAELQGGRFGNGFVTAGASAFLSPIPEAASSNPAGQTVVAAVISGTISRATGGKFANGAVTGAFQFATSRIVSRSSRRSASSETYERRSRIVGRFKETYFDTYSDLTPEQKLSAALTVVQDSCLTCEMPPSATIVDDLPAGVSGATSTFSRAVRFAENIFDFGYPDGPLDALTTVYHEVMHVNQNIFERWKGGWLDTVNQITGSEPGLRTFEHQAIYDISPLVAANNLSAYKTYLGGMRK